MSLLSKLPSIQRKLGLPGESSLSAHLSSEWAQLLDDSQVEVNPSSDPLFNTLCTAYNEPHRHYHNLNHIAYMLAQLDSANSATPTARWATWYHDIVYRPGKSDNEYKSAKIALETMTELGIDPNISTAVSQIINATKNHRPNENSDDSCKSVLDADMAILGAPEQEYENYCRQVRKEFSAIPSFLYKRGRKKFLQSVLKQERIFTTEYFYREFERSARNNVQHEITTL